MGRIAANVERVIMDETANITMLVQVILVSILERVLICAEVNINVVAKMVTMVPTVSIPIHVKHRHAGNTVLA